MKQVKFNVPIEIMQTFPGISCSLCGFTGTILGQVDVEKDGRITRKVLPGGGPSFCPNGEKRSPVELERDPYIKIKIQPPAPLEERDKVFVDDIVNEWKKEEGLGD